MSEPATPESAPLSVEAAVASLLAPPVEQEQPAPEAPEGAAETPEEPQGESDTPEDTGEAQEPGDGEEDGATEQEAEAEPLDAPHRWNTEEKAHFATLDRTSQEILLRQEAQRETVTEKAKAEAAEKTKAADAELSKVQALAAALDERLPQWIETFTSKWGTQAPDWVAIAQEHGVEAMTLAKTQFEAERQKLQEAATETANAKQLAHQQFVKTEFAKLAEIAPELAPSATDPTQGAETRQKVTKYLIERGFPQSAIAQISAEELSLAHDAMLYREGKKALSAAPKPKPAATPLRPPVRPAAAAAQSSTQSRAKSAEGRFHQKPSVENAIALLLAGKA